MQNNIPPIIQSLIEQLNDSKTPFWIRQNACLTLENIVRVSQMQIDRFNKKVVKSKEKEIRK